MALQGKFLRFCNAFKGVLQNTSGYNPGYQQIAGLRQSLVEKYHIPPKPKRPLTPYFKFMTKIRPELKREQPNTKITELVRQIAVRWESADPQMKLKLETEYRKEQQVYAKERLEYDTQLTDEQKHAIKLAAIEQHDSKEKRKYKKKCKDNNKPKKPCTGFVLYMKTQLPSRGEREFRVFQRDVADSWVKLPESDKKPFVDEMLKQMKDYQKQMVDWERKMIKLGNTDIVRQDALIEPRPRKLKKGE